MMEDITADPKVALEAKVQLEYGYGPTEDEVTLRDYFKLLLVDVWQQAEGFSGKRPWGNGNWQGHLADALARAGVIEAKFDDEGYLEDYPDNFDEFIVECINAL